MKRIATFLLVTSILASGCFSPRRNFTRQVDPTIYATIYTDSSKSKAIVMTNIDGDRTDGFFNGGIFPTIVDISPGIHVITVQAKLKWDWLIPVSTPNIEDTVTFCAEQGKAYKIVLTNLLDIIGKGSALNNSSLRADENIDPPVQFDDITFSTVRPLLVYWGIINGEHDAAGPLATESSRAQAMTKVEERLEKAPYEVAKRILDATSRYLMTTSSSGDKQYPQEPVRRAPQQGFVVYDDSSGAAVTSSMRNDHYPQSKDLSSTPPIY